MKSFCSYGLTLLMVTISIQYVLSARSSRSSRTSTTTTTSTTKAPKLPDLPNAIHYPIYVPATTTDTNPSSSFLSPTFDLMGLSSNPWSSSLSPLSPLSASSSTSSSSFMPMSYDWMGPPFGIEVYDEQTLLRNREKLRHKQMDALRSRERLRHQASNVQRQVHGIPVINSYNSNFDGNDRNSGQHSFSYSGNNNNHNRRNNFGRQFNGEDVLLIAVNGSGQWDYSNQADWRNVSPDCAGRRQSPIDIDDICNPKSTTTLSPDLKLEFLYYDRPLPSSAVEMVNNGHTAQLTLKGADVNTDWAPKVSGPAFDYDIFQFVQLHFHWDQNDTQGSEHSIHGSREALEMHMVHFNTKYGSMAEAGKYGDGLLVLATLFHADVVENPLMSPIVNNLESIIQANAKTSIMEPVILESLLPPTYDTFYMYQGSLTTPPCSESVTWILFTQVPSIGYAQLYEFEQMDNNENRFVGDTNRNLQPLNGRSVYASNNDHCKPRKNQKRLITYPVKNQQNQVSYVTRPASGQQSSQQLLYIINQLLGKQ